MKKTLLTIALVAVASASFAQGKIGFGNNSAHLIYFADKKPADAALAGVVNGALPSGATILVDLFGGTSAGTMTLQTTTTINTLAGGGGFGNVNFTSPNLAGGTQYTMQVQVREQGFATAAASQAGGGYYGYSQTFLFTPSATIAFNSIVNATFSQWANGTVVLPNGLGAIGLSYVPVPEPSSMALAGLGAASLLIFRRRK